MSDFNKFTEIPLKDWRTINRERTHVHFEYEKKTCSPYALQSVILGKKSVLRIEFGIKNVGEY
jgi:hypothetical protein